MTYCTECGTRVRDNANFCQECGGEINTQTGPMDTSDVKQNDEDVENGSEKAKAEVFIASFIMAIIIGFFAAWATTNMGISTAAFLLTGIGSLLFLYQKENPNQSLGTGLYVTAGLMILTPILFYFPLVISSSGEPGFRAAGEFIGSILGMFIWGFIFLLLAIVTAALGRYFKKRAYKQLHQQT